MFVSFSRVRVEMARERRDGRDNRNRFDRRSPRRDDRRGGSGGIRKGIPPGRKTNYRVVVENMSSKTSWQVRISWEKNILWKLILATFSFFLQFVLGPIINWTKIKGVARVFILTWEGVFLCPALLMRLGTEGIKHKANFSSLERIFYSLYFSCTHCSKSWGQTQSYPDFYLLKNIIDEFLS